MNSESRNIYPRIEELSLRQWIEKSAPESIETTSMISAASQPSRYINSAISIALKLTEYLIEAEEEDQDGDPNHIPLASISIENVRVLVKEEDPLMEDFGESGDLSATDVANLVDLFREEEREEISMAFLDPDEPPAEDIVENEVIDYVKIVFQKGVKLDVGDKTSRLLALGVIFYELFSRQRPQFELDALIQIGALDDTMFRETETNRVRSHGDVSMIEIAPHNKRRQVASCSGNDAYSKSMDELESQGIPQSLLALIGNLLDCRHGEFCNEDAFKSFADVRLDLQLMLDESSCFLDDIKFHSEPLLTFRDKLYGREQHIAKLEEAYEQSLQGQCEGVMIVGEAGVGKSKLALHIQQITSAVNGHFLHGKFDQNEDIKPLSIIGSALNDYCNMFTRDSTRRQKIKVAKALRRALGVQAAALVELVPSLSKILPLATDSGDFTDCVDSAKRIRFFFCVLVQMLSTYLAKPVTLFLDDVQWADPSSLSLIKSFLGEARGSRALFIVCCFRDNEFQSDDNLLAWQRSSLDHSVEEIRLANLEPETVNRIVSDTLHLSPRITSPFSFVLHRKTRGNPLFVRQTLESLRKEGLLYFGLNPRRWMWDLEKIKDFKIADDVVALLMREMRKLPENLQLGLVAASCVGSSVDKCLLDVLSKEVAANLRHIFSDIVKKGFMDISGTKYRFVHDRIQQAAYGLVSSQQRRSYHARFGLAIWSHTPTESNDEMLFIAVNQINHGGSQVFSNMKEAIIAATLNLKAGKRSITLSDFTSALKFFEHGVSFLGAQHWKRQYELSLELFDLTIEAACVVNNSEVVKLYSENLLSHARCFEDKLNTFYVAVKALRESNLLQEAQECAFNILIQLGEDVPKPCDDVQVRSKIREMSRKVRDVSDELILKLNLNQQKKSTFLMKVYHVLTQVLHFNEPLLVASVSLRMVEIVLSEGLCPMAPYAFAYFGSTLILIELPTQAYRMGALALRLLEELKLVGHTPGVIANVRSYISWTSEPIQSIAQAHLHGYELGKQSGDVSSSALNYSYYLSCSLISGQNLATFAENARDFLIDLLRQNQKFFANYLAITCHHVGTLIGEPVNVPKKISSKIPCEKELMALAKNHNISNLLIVIQINQVARAVLFRQYDEALHEVNILGVLEEKKCYQRLNFLGAIFFEGLFSYHMARQTRMDKWVNKGEAALTVMKQWSHFSSWNFDNKALILEAEKMFFVGDSDKASTLYDMSIRSAQEHKFVNEEAISWELAGMYYYERKCYRKSLEYLANSIDCYEKWGAMAVAKRVKMFVECAFNSVISASNEPRLDLPPISKAPNKRQFRFE